MQLLQRGNLITSEPITMPVMPSKIQCTRVAVPMRSCMDTSGQELGYVIYPGQCFACIRSCITLKVVLAHFGKVYQFLKLCM